MHYLLSSLTFYVKHLFRKYFTQNLEPNFLVKKKKKELLAIILYFSLQRVKGGLTLSVMPENLTLLLLNTTCPVLANSVDPDQLASEDAN